MRNGWWAWAIAMMLCIGAARADGVLTLETGHGPIDLASSGEAWIDPTGTMTPEVVSADSSIAWTPTHAGAVYAIDSHKALWLHFTVDAPGSERWYLQVPYPAVDRITLYSLDGNAGWGLAAGDTIDVADWPVPNRFPLIPLSRGRQEYLVRVDNSHAFSAPLQFVSETHLLADAQQGSMVLGIYFGLAGLAVMLALLSAVYLRDRCYALYALSVTLMALTQASLTGIAGLELWPRAGAWNDYSAIALPVVAVGSLQWFFSEVVSLHERSRRLHRVLLGLGLLSIVAAVAIAFVDRSHRIGVMIPYIAVAGTVGLGAVVWAARRGDRWAGWLLLGALPVAIGSLFPMLRAAGVIPLGFLATHGMQIGMSFELPIVLLILILRSQHRREHIRRIHGFDKVDPATGLLNGMVFEQALVRMMARSQRLKYQSAVLIVDIVNADQIRKQYGPRSAEELPLQVAGRLLAAARDIDAVARLGDLRFGMLIEGPLSTEDAASEGPRIVARCLMPFRNKPIEWVAQVRVAQTLVPTQRADAKQVIDRLEALLANVSPESKRAVFTLTS